MIDFGVRSRRAGKSMISRMLVDHALATGKIIAVCTGDQLRTSNDLLENTDADLCLISGDMFVIPHKRK